MSYKKLKDPKTGEESKIILRTTDNAFIPKSEANSDYQEYLEWEAIDGNDIQEAD
tara:strand:+ start:741 stop:905 length:165 start_codon:yes stop_codon:yes gene_type:complete